MVTSACSGFFYPLKSSSSSQKCTLFSNRDFKNVVDVKMCNEKFRTFSHATKFERLSIATITKSLCYEIVVFGTTNGVNERCN